MESLRELYRIGAGPSSSHTMGPQRAALRFPQRHPAAARYRATLYGSLAATGRGHLTDVALERVLQPLEIVSQPDVVLPFHPNGMDFAAHDETGRVLGAWRVFSVGGGRFARRACRRRHPSTPVHDGRDAGVVRGARRAPLADR